MQQLLLTKSQPCILENLGLFTYMPKHECNCLNKKKKNSCSKRFIFMNFMASADTLGLQSSIISHRFPQFNVGESFNISD